MTVVPLVTAIVAAGFALLVLWRWRRVRRPPLLSWGIGLAMFAIAAFAGYLHRLNAGDTSTTYGLFYFFGALLNVPWLGLGTMYLLAPRRIAAWAGVLVLLFSLLSVYAVLATPVDPRAVADTGRGYEAGSLPRLLALIGNVAGSAVLIGGALWSAYGFARTRALPRRVLANVLIAAGVFIAAAGGTVAFTGTGGVLEFTNLAGLVVMLVGFLLA